jgi:drug/metabolite transporter (DMT)-like permease
VSAADLILLAANLVYATSYAATRLTLVDLPPGVLAVLRCAVGAVLLLPFARRGERREAMSPGDHLRIAAMGILGIGAAFACSHWGIVRSTAANAALLIIVEPVAIMVLSPLVLGERLRPSEAVGSALGLTGTLLVVLDGIPGVTTKIAPHWRGDLLLVLAGVAYAAYTLIGRDVLRRHPATPVTVLSLTWGAISLIPVAALEWSQGVRPVWTGQAILGAAYLAVVITAIGYAVWNWALGRVSAPRAAVFLAVQPIAGALLGVAVLGDPFTVFTAVGALLITTGLMITARAT